MVHFPSATLPAADATFTVREVARHADISLRTIRHYVKERVLPAPEFRSSKTRYGRDFLVRLRAAITLRRRGLHVHGVRETLETTPPDEMIRLAGYTVTDGAATGGGGATGQPGARGTPEKTGPLATAAVGRKGAMTPGVAAGSTGVPTLPVGFVGPYRAGAAPAHESWEHFEVCPGVKLLVRREADPEAWRVAQEIVALFGPKGS